MLLWRRDVDEALERLLHDPPTGVLSLVELGLHHEQHQELLLMDLLDAFHRQPLAPIYSEGADLMAPTARPDWLRCDGGLVEIGTNGGSFHFDNEGPRHRIWLEPFALSSELVSVGDYRNFINDGGYQRPDLWMSEGWALVQQGHWKAPRYWRDGELEFTLAGLQPLDPTAPVRHLSWLKRTPARWHGPAAQRSGMGGGLHAAR